MDQREQPPADSGVPGDPDAGHPRLEEAYMWNVVSYLISGPVMFGGITPKRLLTRSRTNIENSSGT